MKKNKKSTETRKPLFINNDYFTKTFEAATSDEDFDMYAWAREEELLTKKEEERKENIRRQAEEEEAKRLAEVKARNTPQKKFSDRMRWRLRRALHKHQANKAHRKATAKTRHFHTVVEAMLVLATLGALFIIMVGLKEIFPVYFSDAYNFVGIEMLIMCVLMVINVGVYEYITKK